MEDKDYIVNLICLDFSGDLDHNLKEELQAWIGSSEKNLTEYNHIIRLLEYADQLAAMKKIDVDNDLLHVKQRINKKSKAAKLITLFQQVAAILAIPLLIYTIWTVRHMPEEQKKAITMKCTETSRGVRSQVQLSDGTKVWLNSGSKLTYPEEFTGNSREVKLTGEAYFQVKSDKLHPFYVESDTYKIKATGTRFNVSNYPEDKELSAYLEHGQITLLSVADHKKPVSVPVKEKQIVILNKAKNQYQVQASDSAKHLAWIDGVLKFKNDNADDVAARLGRWFNADIIFDQQLKKSGYVFTATFKQESLEEALRLLSYSSPITYKIISENQKDDSSFSKRKVIITKKSSMQ